MSLKCGIIGLPNVGKSTLFNALTRGGAEVKSYPFTTIEPNTGIVPVPDPRLEKLAAALEPRAVIPAVVTFVDIAGLVKGASKGEGLGNQFLAHIREVDVLIHVLRCFTAPEITHVPGEINPVRDLETVTIELLLADLEIVTRRKIKVEKLARAGEKKYEEELRFLQDLAEALNRGKEARFLFLPGGLRRELPLLTTKPVLYVANTDEQGILSLDTTFPELYKRVKEEGASLIALSAKLEAELAELPPEEKKEFLTFWGLEASGLDRLVEEAYRLLGLFTFFTAQGGKLQAWTVPRGTRAFEAAGKIHSDFAQGFIRAEVIAYQDLITAGSLIQAREKGLLRLEGRDYLVQDGDLITFRFKV